MANTTWHPGPPADADLPPDPGNRGETGRPGSTGAGPARPRSPGASGPEGLYGPFRSPGGPLPPEESQALAKMLGRLAWFLDESLPVPGTKFRIGLDGIIGLIPGVGDLAGAAMSSFVLAMAARMGVPKTLLFRMGFNVLLESLVGLVPFAGDLFDFAFKANSKNVRLLKAYFETPRKAERSNLLFSVLIFIGVLAVLLGIAWLAFLLARAAFIGLAQLFN